jgi:prolipoprotein diacylglyceryltransferase
MVAAGVNPLTNPFDIVLVRGGVDTVAASIAALATLAWVFRSELTALDVVAPAALLGLAGWHAGCLWTGSCLGAATSGDWGIVSPAGVARHPTELYAAVALIILAFAVTRPRTPFVASGLALAAAAGVRAATQPIRPSLTGGPMWAYFAAVGLGLLVAAFGRRWAPREPAVNSEP